MVWSGLGASRGVAGTTTATRLPSGATSKATAPLKFAAHTRGLSATNVPPRVV